MDTIFKIFDKVQVKDIPEISDSFKNKVGTIVNLVSTYAGEYALVEFEGMKEEWGKDKFHFRLTSITLYKSPLYHYAI